jgi:predicted nuclease of predicted toxin-antitoxin system
LQAPQRAENRDFCGLLTVKIHNIKQALTHTGKPSVIQIRAGDVIPEAAAAPVISALQKLISDIEKGALVTIDTHKTRLNLLPL